MDPIETRLAELEIRYTHQARLLEELDGVVIEQGERLRRLEQENLRLRRMLQQLAEAPPESPDE